jgi:hypothetical protein
MEYRSGRAVVTVSKAKKRGKRRKKRDILMERT